MGTARRERRTLKSCINLKSLIPTSSMSRTLLSYIRTRVRLFGLRCGKGKFNWLYTCGERHWKSRSDILELFSPFFGVRTNHEKSCVIFCRPELE